MSSVKDSHQTNPTHNTPNSATPVSKLAPTPAATVTPSITQTAGKSAVHPRIPHTGTSTAPHTDAKTPTALHKRHPPVSPSTEVPGPSASTSNLLTGMMSVFGPAPTEPQGDNKALGATLNGVAGPLRPLTGTANGSAMRGSLSLATAWRDSFQENRSDTIAYQAVSAQGGMQAAQMAVTPKAPHESAPVGNRLLSFKQSTQAIRSLVSGRGTNDQLWSLVYHSRTSEGAKGLMDTLETTVVKEGSKQMQKLFEASTRNADAILGFSSILANLSQTEGERMLGTLLLTTDGLGGQEAVQNLFSKMSQQQDCSSRLAQFLANSTRTAAGVRGLTELMENWTQPAHDLDWSGAQQLGSVLSNSTKTIAGSHSVGQALQNISAETGGGQTIARALNRMSRSKEGGQEVTRLLQNLAFSQNGAVATSKLLARASQSRNGARQLLDSFLNMTNTPSGARNVGQLLYRLADAPESAGLWTNFANDSNNTGRLAELMNKMNSQPESSALLGQALETMADNPKCRAIWQVFEDRVAASPLVSRELDRALENACEASSYLRSGPSLSELADLTVKSAGAAASGQLSKVEAFAAQKALETENRPSLLRADFEERLEESRQSTELYSVESSPSEDKGVFRPGDHYSEETLKRAKICVECGYRTTSLGFCPRCAVNHQRD